MGTVVVGFILNTVLIAALAGAYVSQGLAQSDATEAAGLSAGSFAAHGIIELVVIVIGFLGILWLTKEDTITMVHKGEQNVSSYS